jgi:hypothetical protein
MGCTDCTEGRPPAKADFADDHERGCTDILFLLAFIASWVATFIVFTAAVELGADPSRIIHGVDYEGHVCDGELGYGKFTMWPVPLPQAYDIKVCVDSCEETATNDMGYLPTSATYESKPYMTYCVPTATALQELAVVYGGNKFSFLSSGNSTVDQEDMLDGGSSGRITRAMSDLMNSWWVILVSMLIALVISFMYAKALKACGQPLVYMGLLMIAVGGFAMGYAMLDLGNAQKVEGEYQEYADWMIGVGWFVICASILFVIVILVLRKKIDIAIEIVVEAGHAIVDMPWMIAFPIVPGLLGLAYIMFWVFLCVFIFSVTNENKAAKFPTTINKIYSKSDQLVDTGDFATRTTYTDLEWNREMEPYFGWHFFHLLWVMQFLIYFNYLVIASAIAKWYFTPWQKTDNEEKDLDAMGSSPVCGACRRTCRFNLGSIAFGSLIIAICNFARACIKYIEETTKAANGEPNKLQKAIFCCIQCCLKCVECCMDKISKNAFCWIAIWGDNYLSAACNSFALIWANLVRASVITIVGGYLLLIGKVFVSLSTTAVCAYIIENAVEDVSSLFMPCVVIFILALIVAHLFMVEFDTTIDTVFMCFLVDEKFNAQSNDMYASKKLQEILGVDSKHFEASKKKHLATQSGPADEAEMKSVAQVPQEE